MDAWLHTQSLPKKLLQCWKNIKNHSLSEFQPSSTQPSHPDLTSKIFKELENINKRLDKQEAKLSYVAVRTVPPDQVRLIGSTGLDSGLVLTERSVKERVGVSRDSACGLL